MLELGKSTYSRQEDEKTSCWNSTEDKSTYLDKKTSYKLELGKSTYFGLILDKKTRRRIVGTRQVDLFETRRREDKLLELDKSTYLRQEDEKTSCWNSTSRLI